MCRRHELSTEIFFHVSADDGGVVENGFIATEQKEPKGFDNGRRDLDITIDNRLASITTVPVVQVLKVKGAIVVVSARTSTVQYLKEKC